MDGVPDIGDQETPVVANLFMQLLLFKLGGQVSFHTDELNTLLHGYLGTRIAYDRTNEIITLTLRSILAENDRPVAH